MAVRNYLVEGVSGTGKTAVCTELGRRGFRAAIVLEVDLDTLRRRLDARPAGEWGARREERDLVVRLHRTGEDVPAGDVVVDAARPLGEVVDAILVATGVDVEGEGRVVPQARVELATFRLGGGCSIH